MAKGGYQRRRIEQKHQAERDARKRARRNRKIAKWAIGGVIILALALATVPRGGGKYGVAFAERTGFFGSKAKASPSATPSTSPSASSKLPDGCTQATGKTKTAKYAAPAMTIDTSKTYTAIMKTSCGTITIALDAKKAPKTVNNFVFLARKKFYDGSIFHRVIAAFGGPTTDMIQGGDAVNANGTGDAGYKFNDENPAPFTTAGMIAMANSGPNTNGSQFFILNGPWSGGNSGGGGNYSVFGTVTKGIEAVHRIASSPQDTQNKPDHDVVIESVTIEEK